MIGVATHWPLVLWHDWICLIIFSLIWYTLQVIHSKCAAVNRVTIMSECLFGWCNNWKHAKSDDWLLRDSIVFCLFFPSYLFAWIVNGRWSLVSLIINTRRVQSELIWEFCPSLTNEIISLLSLLEYVHTKPAKFENILVLFWPQFTLSQTLSYLKADLFKNGLMSG